MALESVQVNLLFAKTHPGGLAGFRPKTAMPRPTHYVNRRGLIPLDSLDETMLFILRVIIQYRNAETGAGKFTSGKLTKTKVTTGLKIAMRNGVMAIVGRLEKKDEISKIGIETLRKAGKNIEQTIKISGEETWPGISKALDETEKAFPEVVGDHSLFGRPDIAKFLHDRMWTHEMILLDYLRIIDTEIDIFLGVFGLTKHSEI